MKTVKFKSKFEQTFHSLTKLAYETDSLPYVQNHTYTPDFKINANTFVETKGHFSASDRTKHLLIKQQHPEITVIFVFQAPFNKLSKKSRTTYADWATKNGFKWTTVGKFNVKDYV